MPLVASGETTVLSALMAGTRYVSLHTANPGPSGASEVSGGAYARQGSTFSQSGSNPTTASNADLMTFPQASAPWGTITHFGVWDAVSGGNLLAYEAVTTAKAIDTADVARWPIGSLTVTAD